ncbi:MAG: sarcosine oxidase subunit gamma [Gammaproteobacteria bacterium]|nr:sarcosine oxidase subunit gamma [Gammaproteobacteria bacterium]
MSDLQNGESPLVQIDFNQFEKVKGIKLTELKFQGHLNLRGRLNDKAFCKAISDAIGVELTSLKANTFILSEDFKVYWLGPDEWLIVTPPDQQLELKNTLQQALQGIFSSVTDVSSGQTIISISGFNARSLIEKGCTIDLHPRQFKKGDCAQTHLSKATVLLSVVKSSEAFEIIIRRSFADYLGLWLLDSSSEFV